MPSKAAGSRALEHNAFCGAMWQAKGMYVYVYVSVWGVAITETDATALCKPGFEGLRCVGGQYAAMSHWWWSAP